MAQAPTQKPAEQLGMATIHCQDPSSLERDLARLL